ncbi:hypothetical protein [uncultured Friedmanniella sp.]|uniref:hypothetical protein n=1 Tax=uncultured Friedmanniella sp. TaxID=335381 RepID=UPI0035CAD7CA
MHRVDPTTHTVEMDQIAELNELLRQYRPDTITAADLDLAGAATAPAPTSPLSATAVLVELRWDGSPAYPYIHGAFGSGTGARTVLLHTHALRELSHRLHAHHIWGVGSVPDPA